MIALFFQTFEEQIALLIVIVAVASFLVGHWIGLRQ
jgi:NADH:ubiquinone oxidoreductase subunit 2 (subunit N)